MISGKIKTLLQCQDAISKTSFLEKEEQHKILIATQNKNYYERKIHRLEALKRKIQKQHSVMEPVA